MSELIAIGGEKQIGLVRQVNQSIFGVQSIAPES